MEISSQSFIQRGHAWKMVILLRRQNNLILSLAFTCFAPVSPFFSCTFSFSFFFPFPQLPSRWKSLQHKERSAWETRNSSSVKVRVIWKMPYETQLDANVTSYNNTGGFNWDHFIEVIQVKLWHSWTLITSSALKKSNAKDKTVLKKRRTDEDR